MRQTTDQLIRRRAGNGQTGITDTPLTSDVQRKASTTKARQLRNCAPLSERRTI